MRGGIRVSEKYGVNPSMGICFWCGEEDGTILLPGKLPGDVEAPRRMCATYEPCKGCGEIFEKGIHCIEVADCHRLRRPEIMKRSGYAPTGRFVVVTRKWIEESLDEEKLSKQILKKGSCLMTEHDFSTIFASEIA